MYKLNTYLVVLSAILILSCGKTSGSFNNLPLLLDTSHVVDQIASEAMMPNKYMVVYKYDSTYTDSMKVGESWYLNDSLIKKSGKFNTATPFESEFFSSTKVQSACGRVSYTTFDSNVCEVGGTSAWNKYLIIYDLYNRPIEVKHYKAWWDEGLDDEKRPDKPNYFLGEIIKYAYVGKTSIQKVYIDKGKLVETITKTHDDNNRLISESWDAWDEYRYKAYYSYY